MTSNTSGEQSDPNSGFVYLRQRWMNSSTGRHLSVDPYDSDINRARDSFSLNKYLYANANLVNAIDPSGKITFLQVSVSIAVIGILASQVNYTFGGFARKLTCDQIKVKRKDIDLDKSESEDAYGHWWIEFMGESYGWWPKYPVDKTGTLLGVNGELNGVTTFGGSATKDPHHGDADQNVKTYGVQLIKSGKCESKTCLDAMKDFRTFANGYSGSWSWPLGQNCHSFQEEGLKAACLELKEK